MGNQHASSSISSSLPKLKGVCVSMEEEETKTNLKQVSPLEIVSEKRIIEKPPNYNLGVLKTKNDLMKKYPQNDEFAYICGHCNKKFSSPRALGGHLNTHINNQDLVNLNSSGLVFGKYLQDVLPNDHNHLEISYNPFKPLIGDGCSSNTMNMTMNHHATPPHGSFIENTSYDHLELSLGPFKPKEDGGRSSNNINPLFNGAVTTDMNINWSPVVSPNDFIIEKSVYGTFLRDSLPSYNYHSHGLSNDNQLRLSFGASKSTGGSNNSFNGGTKDMNSTVFRPKALYPFLTDKASYGSSSCDLLPYCNYPRTTMFPLHENDLDSSYMENLISKSKNNIMESHEDDDDDEDNKVTEDDDKFKIEEAEAKSWGRDLSLSI